MSGDDDAHGDDDWQKLMSKGFENVDKLISNAKGDNSGAIEHAADAIDYADEDLSDDDLPDEEAPSGNNPIDEDENAGSKPVALGATPVALTSTVTATATPLTIPLAISSIKEVPLGVSGVLPIPSTVGLGTSASSAAVAGIPTSTAANASTSQNIQGNPALWNRTGTGNLFSSTTNNFPNLPLPTTSTIPNDFFSMGTAAPTLGREMSLEERVGSDYAAAVSAMTFDDDWFTGSMATSNVNTSVAGSSSFPAFDSLTNFPLPTSSGVGMGLELSSALGHIDHALASTSLPIVPNVPLKDSLSLSPLSDSEKQSGFAKDGEPEKNVLKQYFPDFQRGKILKMNTIFGSRGRVYVLPTAKNPKPIFPTRVSLEIEPDQKSMFQRNKPLRHEDPFYGYITSINPQTSAAVADSTYRMVEDAEITSKNQLDPLREEENILIATADWNLDQIWESSDSDVEMDDLAPSVPAPNGHATGLGSLGSSDEESDDDVPVSRTTPKLAERRPEASSKKHTEQRPSKRVKIYHPDMYDSEDEEGFFEGVFNFDKSKKVVLDMNDNRLLFTDNVQSLRQGASDIRRQQQVSRPTDISNKNILQRYNISNDRAYDMLKENYQSKVRSIISELTIDHSMVAQRLQSPHFKVKLSKDEMRSFHRPTFAVKPGTVIHFSKIKQRKRKRDKGKPITELLAKTTDLTLGDSAQFFMLEFSEEFPLVLSNFGMGNKLINYYRKTSPDDRTRPKLPTGETNVLGVEDKSAFWNFGFIEPGKVVPALYNKMIRAPIFRHEPNSTDFLLVRSTSGGQGVKHYLRSVPFLFTVGQTFPVTPIPGPHSRKVTTASKNRLKMVVFRLLNKDEHHRINVKDLSPHFPDHNEMQNRQRLKEFMVFQRTGNDYSYWKIKPSETLPNEDGIRAMITPEDIALLEAMQVGQQHLEDAGYGKTVDDDDEEAEGTSIEEQLAPWNITRNFINATQGKAMLQLHGEGDPSGSGEAFSFLRISMKGGFRAMGESVNERLDKSKFGGHSYNVALQQKAYDEEIKRIWYTQAESLSNPKTDHLTWDEDESKREGESTGPANSVANTPQPKGDTESIFSHASANQRNKVLRITRFVRDKNGMVQRKVEVVNDPNLIRAYIKRRQKIEDEQMAYVFLSFLFFPPN